jgi:hypothetical protein
MGLTPALSSDGVRRTKEREKVLKVLSFGEDLGEAKI